MEQLGIVGVGKMGSGLAHQALRKEIKVVGVTRGRAPRELVDAIHRRSMIRLQMLAAIWKDPPRN